jgi:hypothetical protein
VAIAKLLDISNVQIGDRRVDTYQGVIQGSCLSPSLFSLYSMQLIHEINTHTQAKILMYADDVCIAAPDRFEARRAIGVVQRW